MPRQIVIKPALDNWMFADGWEDFSVEELRRVSAFFAHMAFKQTMEISNFLNLEIADEHLFKGVKNNHYV